MELNHTHDVTQRSWLEAANVAGTDFPLQNLPIGVFRRRGGGETWRGGIAIGDQIVDLAALQQVGCMDGLAVEAARAATATTLNALLDMGPAAWQALRHSLFELLRAGSPHESGVRKTLVSQAEAEYAVPVRIGDYTDFYTSLDHAVNCSRPLGMAISPNFDWLPIAYHGRVSSIGVSGQQVYRPKGQYRPNPSASPVHDACRRLDYELELGAVIGVGNPRGTSIPLREAQRHIFGLCLLNDWSARDIQSWEMQPLGPFLAKNFATTISPWLVTLEALLPYRTTWSRVAERPQPLDYLSSGDNSTAGAFDIQLEVWLQTQAMRDANLPPHRLSRSNFLDAYWTIAQLVAHHTVNGCNLQSGDLLGTGTLSGPTAAGAASLLELTQGGKQALTLPNGQTRTFLEDGDTVILRGFCEQPGARRIGFGECAGTLLSSR